MEPWIEEAAHEIVVDLACRSPIDEVEIATIIQRHFRAHVTKTVNNLLRESCLGASSDNEEG